MINENVLQENQAIKLEKMQIEVVERRKQIDIEEQEVSLFLNFMLIFFYQLGSSIRFISVVIL